jgi:hypothetical protein
MGFAETINEGNTINALRQRCAGCIAPHAALSVTVEPCFTFFTVDCEFLQCTFVFRRMRAQN